MPDITKLASGSTGARPSQTIVMPADGVREQLVVDVAGDPTGLLAACLLAADGTSTTGVVPDAVVMEVESDRVQPPRQRGACLMVVDRCPVAAVAAVRLVQDGSVGGVVDMSEAATHLVPAVRLVGDGYSVVSPTVVALAEALPPLSERAVDVLDLVRRGLTNEAIGRRLDVSTSTVKRELGAMFAGFGVKSRAELVAAALDLVTRLAAGSGSDPDVP